MKRKLIWALALAVGLSLYSCDKEDDKVTTNDDDNKPEIVGLNGIVTGKKISKSTIYFNEEIAPTDIYSYDYDTSNRLVTINIQHWNYLREASNSKFHFRYKNNVLTQVDIEECNVVDTLITISYENGKVIETKYLKKSMCNGIPDYSYGRSRNFEYQGNYLKREIISHSDFDCTFTFTADNLTKIIYNSSRAWEISIIEHDTQKNPYSNGLGILAYYSGVHILPVTDFYYYTLNVFYLSKNNPLKDVDGTIKCSYKYDTEGYPMEMEIISKSGSLTLKTINKIEY